MFNLKNYSINCYTGNLAAAESTLSDNLEIDCSQEFAPLSDFVLQENSYDKPRNATDVSQLFFNLITEIEGI